MQESIFTRVRARFMAWGIVGLLILLVIATVACEQTAEPDPGTSDDCFGGALSDDPLHCEVIEWAHDEGVIEVDGVFRAGNALLIYLDQPARPDDAALQKMLAKAQEVARRTGDYGCVLQSRLCDSGVLGLPSSNEYFLPAPSAYENIRFYPGGAEARRSLTGWRAFEQLWPELEEGATGATDSSSGFDISEVDRIIFPTLSGNCLWAIGLAANDDRVDTACHLWDRAPPSVRLSSIEDRAADGKLHISVKSASGEDEATKIMAAQAWAADFTAGNYTEAKGNLEINTVPYDFEEMWRWTVMLDRFANSSGNTLGIAQVELGFNWLGGLLQDRKYVFPLEDVPNLDDFRRENHGLVDGPRTRLIIRVATYEFEKTVAGLPQLLKQLEIPEFAIGLIYATRDRVYQRVIPHQ